MVGMYILEGKKVIPCTETLEWGKWMQKRTRIIKQERVNKYFISTVFLGLDYDLGMSPVPIENPLIFETMIFDEGNDELMSELDNYQIRYRSYDEAVEGHKKTVKMVRNFLKNN